MVFQRGYYDTVRIMYLLFSIWHRLFLFPFCRTQQDGSLPSLYSQCVSSASEIWLSILVAYKLTEVVLSIIFTLEVRKIRVKGLIDSRMISFSVYIVVLAAIIVPVVVSLSSQPNVRYGVLGAVCLLASTILLCLNFIPKVWSYYM